MVVVQRSSTLTIRVQIQLMSAFLKRIKTYKKYLHIFYMSYCTITLGDELGDVLKISKVRVGDHLIVGRLKPPS